ncbi:hypothetical protein Sste5346_003510 [Sporothrix stenoceras]|uniref:Mediator of RNA polymerase II transcription subunit 13 n=1 Tax=Sporothrix stenoceras TaxID=5173 RepID=A0ABR3ZD47_9PEZI
MEVGEYETNTLAISNIASITFRVYRPVTPASASVPLFAFSPSDVEKALRNDGHLVFADSRRQGIWCFRLLRKDGSAIGSPTMPELNTTIDVGPYKLTIVSEGAFDPSSLVQGKPATSTSTNPVNTPNSSTSSSAALVAAHGVVDAPSSQGTNGSSGGDSEGTQNGGYAPTTSSQAQTSEPRAAFPAVPTKIVYNFFMSAVLASLSTAYCSHAKAIALNNRTFLLPPLDPLWDGEESSRTDSRSLIATLRITLTTAGALLVSLSHSLLRGMGCSEWECYAGVPPPGSAVLTAPWGKFATVQDAYPPFVSADDSRYAMARFKKNGVPLPVVPHAWKSFAAKMLEMRGTSPAILKDSTWLQLEFLLDDEASNNNPVVILWPSVLCFWCLEDSLVTVAPFQKLDPLADLREAYLEELRAEEAASRPKVKEEDAAAEDVVMEDVQTVSSVGKGTQSDGPSPLGIRHPLGPGAATSAAGAIYPTPPDGILGLVGATPTFDGSTSSPGNLAGTSAPVDLDSGAADRPSGAEEGFGDWPNITARQDDQDQAFMGEPDDLLGGDIGADMFGDDITDADFNFFDDTKQAEASIANTSANVNPNVGPSSAPSGPLAQDKMDVDFGSRTSEVLAANAQQAPVTQATSQGATAIQSQNAQASRAAAPAMPPPPPPTLSQQTSPQGKSNGTTGRADSKAPGSPVFTKPELRHARSNLSDNKKSGSKRSPSPFNAMTVFKRVRAIAEANKALPVSTARQHLPTQPGKMFEGLRFTEFMIQNNKKYELNGKFGFSWPHPEADMLSDVSSATSPTAFRRPLKKQPGLSDSSPQFATLISSITRGLKSSSLHAAPSPLLIEDSGDTSSNSSSTSSSSEDSDGDEAPLAITAAHRKMRARAMAELIPSPEAATDLSRAYSEGVWDFPIARFFAEPLPQPAELNFADDDIADAAQILTQQITHATIRSVFNEDDGQDLQKSKLRQTLLQRIRYSVATLEDSLPAALDGASRCALKPYLDVQDTLQSAPPGRLHPRAPPGSDQRIPNLFAAPTPLVGIRRNESALSIKPTGIEFWEVLGLEPLHGPKDIRAVCAYPNYQGLSNDVSSFLSRMRIVYESLRLGSHEQLSSKGSVADGMVAFNSQLSSSSPLSQSSPGAEFSGVDQVHKLAQALAAEDTPGKSLVVYFVYCPDITTAIVDACLAFQRLSQLYEIAVTSRSSEPNDLVLQLIPIDFFSSPTSLSVSTPTDLLYLSLEVYDRCASPRGPKPAPAFLLEQPPARNLDLKLSPTPLVDVQRENSCIHVAYAVSADERWITAAWTDSSGWRQFSSAYWIGRKDESGSANSFDAVAREIWTNTCAIVSNLKVHWRAIIAKCGQMDPEEINIWADLAKVETRASMSLTLVSVDTQPTLELLPPVITVAPTVLSQLSVQTLAQTPQASVFSPEQSGNPVTPAGGFANNPTTPAGTPAGGAPTPATPGGLGKPGAPSSPAIPNTPSGAGANATANATAAAAANATSDASAKLAAAGADPNTVADIEGNVVLVDVTDNTWIAVAAHRLNTASTWVDVRPALLSGYLIKRGGIGRDDAPVVLEANVVYVDPKHRVSDALARDILTSYRALGTLARVRGILDSERDARPWHIAAAERAARALCRWM